MGLITKIFGTYSERQIKKLEKIAEKIEALAPKYAAMSDEELKGTTSVLKNRLAVGESLNHEAVLSEFPGNDIGGGIRQLPNGCNGDIIQLFCCSRTHIEQIRYRKIPALLFEV